MEGTFIEQVLQIERIEDVLTLFGNADQNVKIIEEHFGVSIICRGTEVKITGEPEAVSKAQRTVDTLLAMIAKDGNLSEQNVRYVITLVEQGSEQSMAQMNNSCIAITVKGKPVKPKTLGQKKYIDAIQNNTITFGIGPAGTGKTYLATRLGFNSKAIVTGDVTQIDLPNAGRSGLVEAVKVLKNIDDIAIMRLTEKDVVRHKLVQDIIAAYEKYNNREARR